MKSDLNTTSLAIWNTLFHFLLFKRKDCFLSENIQIVMRAEFDECADDGYNERDLDD